MKKYEILCQDDFDLFQRRIGRFIKHNESQGKPFKKMNFTVKSWRKDKTSRQHKFYWVVINEVRKAFLNVGYELTQNEVHTLMKKEYGHTKMIVMKDGKTVSVIKSIADDSEDVNIQVMKDLIDFCIRYAAINLDYEIQDPRAIDNSV